MDDAQRILSQTKGPALAQPASRIGYKFLTTNSPVLLFLGAGASAELGKPLMAGFVQSVIRRLPARLRAVLEALARNRGYDLEDILEDVQSMEALSYVTSFQLGHTTGRPPADLPPLPPSLEAEVGVSHIRDGEASETRLALEREIILTYRDVPLEKALAIYKPLFDVIFSKPGLRTLPIFTTNYDPAIESFHGVAGYSLVTGFLPSKFGILTWSPSAYDSSVFAPDIRNLILFKLHGSANWIYDTRAQQITISAATYVQNDEAFQNRLIYPARRKVAIDDPYATAYDYFHRCCDGARLLIVIGYSFRDYDALIRLRSSLAYNSQLRCLYIGPDPKVLDAADLRSVFQQLPYRFGVPAEWGECKFKLQCALDEMG